MTLKQQLLLISLLTLMLPWAGCQFIRETESALRTNQQHSLASTARLIANSMAQYPGEFPLAIGVDDLLGDPLYGHPLETHPSIDGYFDDWTIGKSSLQSLRGSDGKIRFAIGLRDQFAYLYVEVQDKDVIYAGPVSAADRVVLISSRPPDRTESFSFQAEAPGPVVTYTNSGSDSTPIATVRAFWQDRPTAGDTPAGYNVEARIPLNRLGTHIGISIGNTGSDGQSAVQSASYSARAPGRFVSSSSELTNAISGLVPQGMRLIVTDGSGWRIATVGELQSGPERSDTFSWLRVAYDAMLEPGTESAFAEPEASGREQQPYIKSALDGVRSYEWFRSADDGKAVVAVAEPVTAESSTIGAVVLQQGTDAILSLTNESLTRLMNVTMIATLLVAGGLLGYASLLSRRIRHLSVAAEQALDSDRLQTTLPSSGAADEIGDLSRSFSNVLSQLGDYNDYLRTLAAKLSHELRTPLAIVTSSLENLEHEALGEASKGYTARAKDGAERLRKILAAMSEASRVEELMKNAEPEKFDLAAVLESTVSAYTDAYAHRKFAFRVDRPSALTQGAPELLIQMLDKLVDNAVSFSAAGDTISIHLRDDDKFIRLDVFNPGPPLPERMRSQLFDSMISLRPAKDNKHLGLGLYVAKLIAEGHGGRIDAANENNGVRFSVWLPS